MGKKHADESSKFRKLALEAWDRLEAKRERTLNDLRDIEREIGEMYPAVVALLGEEHA